MSGRRRRAEAGKAVEAVCRWYRLCRESRRRVKVRTGNAVLLTGLAVGTLIAPGLAEKEPFAPASTYPEILAEKHDCWTGAAPAGVEVPGHVIVAKPGSATATYEGPSWAAKALDHVFSGKHPKLVVYAFCR